MRRLLPYLCLALFSGFVLFVSLRGQPGNFDHFTLNLPVWRDNGPFELSVERGRFALAFSLAEDNSVFFSLPVARFATPDLGYKNGQFVSLFAPGMSYLLIPGYLLGKALGAAQVGTYLVVSIFALANALLVFSLARQLSRSLPASALSALVFLFATPAFAYGVSLYQHHLSTFLILSCIKLLTRRSFWRVSAVWFLVACAVPIDYPNLIMMLPIILAAAYQLVTLVSLPAGWKVGFKLTWLFSGIFALIPLGFFLMFNQTAYGSPFQLSGAVAQVKAIDADGRPATPETEKALLDQSPDIADKVTPGYQNENRSFLNFFKTRNLINGFYIHLLSPDRGVVYFAPVVLLGLLGLWALSRHHSVHLPVIFGVVIFNLVFYSLWGDPWGGWAFGSRYLIPTYALLSVSLAVALANFRRQWPLYILFAVLVFYSLFVNTLGAVTSSRNPPRVEVLALEAVTGREEKYTWARNWDYLVSGNSKSLVYNSLLKPAGIPALSYFLAVFALLSASAAGLLVATFISQTRRHV